MMYWLYIWGIWLPGCLDLTSSQFEFWMTLFDLIKLHQFHQLVHKHQTIMYKMSKIALEYCCDKCDLHAIEAAFSMMAAIVERSRVDRLNSRVNLSQSQRKKMMVCGWLRTTSS